MATIYSQMAQKKICMYACMDATQVWGEKSNIVNC